MKKRIIAFILSTLFTIVLSLPAFADTFIYLWSSNYPDDPKSITQEIGYYSNEDGYRIPEYALDYASGISSEDITADSFDAIHLLKSAVWSDYFKRTFAIAENLAPDTYNEKFADLPIENSYEIVGIAGMSDVSYFPRFDGSDDYIQSIDGETLTGQLGWGGADITRKGPNEFGDYYGSLTYNYNPYTLVETRDIDGQTFKVEYVTMLNVDYYVHFSLSNVGFKNGKIVMDINGEEAYRYTVRTDMNTNFHGGMAYQSEAEEAFEEEAWEAYRVFKKNTEKAVGYSETLHAISVKGAEAVFVLYDLDDGNKNLLLEVDQGGVKLKFIVSGVILNDAKPITPGVVQSADDTPGEDKGVSVPAAIVIGVLGGGAAVVGAAAAGQKGQNDKKNKTYRMYVQKDFGDAIRRGGEKPVKIRARMAEIDPGGGERDRNDLTAQIGVSGGGMTVHSVALAGRYCEATVSVPQDNGSDRADITFTFTGEGGSFTNTVVFRVVDGPSLKFVEETEKAGTYNLFTAVSYIEAIPGDGFTYTEKFMIVDAPVPPALKDITAVNTGDFDLQFELTDRQAVYKMTVKNNTKPDPDHDVFAKVKDETFEIHVIVEGEKEPVKGYVTMKLYPEGITVESRDEGKKGDVKYVRVQAYEKEYVGDLDKKWQVSEMKFTLAVKGKDKAVIDPKEAQYRFEKLKGAEGKGTAAAKEQAIAEKYNYKEACGVLNGKFTYDFEPQDMLWEPDNGTFFMVLLPANCEYDGVTYKAEIPLRLRGKDPDPMEEWNKEYAKARERIEKFSLPSQKAYNLQQLEKIAANEPHISTWELRLMCKDVVRAYMKYWTEQHEKDQWTADALDWAVWGLEWVKWIGDCAFSYVVAAYTGPLEAIISPAKDVFANLIGEIGVNIVWGTKFDPEKLEICEAIKNAGDNFVSGGVSDGVGWLASSGMANPAKIKYACAIMGGYFVFAVANNYLLSLEKGENDFYGAVMGAFKDMTVTALKIAASMMFKQWLNSPKFKNEIAPRISKYVSDKLGQNSAIKEYFSKNFIDQKFDQTNTLKGLLNKQVEATRAGIVEKYLSELAGVGGAYVHDHLDTTQRVLGFWMQANSLMFSFPLTIAAADPDAANVAAAPAAEFTVDLDLTKILTNTASGMFGWFYDMFFGGLPAANALMEIPKDPPLPPEKG